MKGLIFTYAMAYGGAVVALYNPFYGLLIYVCFAIIRPESLWFWSVPTGNYSRIVAVALLIGWALRGFGSWRFGRSRATVFAFIGFWSWAVLSTLFAAADGEIGLRYVESLGKILLPFVVGITLIDSTAKLKALAWTIMLSQGYVAWELNLSFWQGFNRIYWVGFAGLDNNSVAIAMVTGAGLAFFLGLHERVWWRKWLAFVGAGLMAHSVMFAFSRGGILALAMTGLLSFILIDKRPKQFAYLALAAAVGLALAGPEVRERFATTFAAPEERDESAQSRLDMWGHCWQIMQENPVLGVGPDHWPLIAAQYGWPAGKEAHSLWLQTGAELGLPGFALLLAFYLITAWRLWPLARRRGLVADEWDIAVARMYIASVVGFMASAQFVSLEGLELPYYIALIGAGALKLNSTGAARVPRGLVWRMTPSAAQPTNVELCLNS